MIKLLFILEKLFYSACVKKKYIIIIVKKEKKKFLCEACNSL